MDTCLIAQLHSIAQYCTSRMCHIAWYTLHTCHCATYFSCFTFQGPTCTCMCKLHNTLIHRHTVDYLIPCTMHAHWWPLLCVHVCSQIRCHTLPHRMRTVEMSYASAAQSVHNSGDVIFFHTECTTVEMSDTSCNNWHVIRFRILSISSRVHDCIQFLTFIIPALEAWFDKSNIRFDFFC